MSTHQPLPAVAIAALCAADRRGAGFYGLCFDVRRLRYWGLVADSSPHNQRGTMARKPNYDFERRERERLKKIKSAERAEAKAKPAQDAADSAPPDATPSED